MTEADRSQCEGDLVVTGQPRRRWARRWALVMATAGALAVVGVGIAAATTTTTTPGGAPSSSPAGHGSPGGPGPYGGGSGGPGGFGAFGAVAGSAAAGPGGGAGGGQKVTSLNGSTITITGPNGKATTYQTSGSTTYTVDGIPASASDVSVGDSVTVRSPFRGFRGPGANGSTTTTTTPATPSALSVNVVLPELSGKVNSVGHAQFVLVDSQGFWRTVKTSGATKYLQSDVSSSSSVLAVGSEVEAVGTIDSDHTSLDSSWVNVILPSVSGEVTAVAGSSIIISTFNGSSVTVTTSGTTHFTSGANPGGIGDVKVGDTVHASGPKASNGDIAAVNVNVAPGAPSHASSGARSGHAGFGPRGGPGGPFGGPASGTPPTPTST